MRHVQKKVLCLKDLEGSKYFLSRRSNATRHYVKEAWPSTRDTHGLLFELRTHGTHRFELLAHEALLARAIGHVDLPIRCGRIILQLQDVSTRANASRATSAMPIDHRAKINARLEAASDALLASSHLATTSSVIVCSSSASLLASVASSVAVRMGARRRCAEHRHDLNLRGRLHPAHSEPDASASHSQAQTPAPNAAANSCDAATTMPMLPLAPSPA